MFLLLWRPESWILRLPGRAILPGGRKFRVQEKTFLLDNRRLKFCGLLNYTTIKNDCERSERQNVTNLYFWNVLFLTFHLALRWIPDRLPFIHFSMTLQEADHDFQVNVEIITDLISENRIVLNNLGTFYYSKQEVHKTLFHLKLWLPIEDSYI